MRFDQAHIVYIRDIRNNRHLNSSIDVTPWINVPHGIKLPPVHQSIKKFYFEICIECNSNKLPDIIIGIRSESVAFNYTSFGEQILYDEEEEKIIFTTKYICKKEEDNFGLQIWNGSDEEVYDLCTQRLVIGFDILRFSINDSIFSVAQMTRNGERFLSPRVLHGIFLDPIVLLNYSQHSINSSLGTDVEAITGNKSFYYRPGRIIIHGVLVIQMLIIII